MKTSKLRAKVKKEKWHKWVVFLFFFGGGGVAMETLSMCQSGSKPPFPSRLTDVFGSAHANYKG